MGEAKRRKQLLGFGYGKTKIFFQEFVWDSLSILHKHNFKRAILKMQFDGEIFTVFPVFITSLTDLDEVFLNSVEIEYNKIKDHLSVLPVLIVPVNKNTGVFFGFDTNSWTIVNCLIAQSFDQRLMHRVMNSEFYVWVDSADKKVRLRFCEEAS
jgi:hypothetical protein